MLKKQKIANSLFFIHILQVFSAHKQAYDEYMIKKCYYCVLFCTLFFASSCLDKEKNLYVELTYDQYFDFNLNQEVALTVDYGFSNKDYIVLFELYDQNPLETKEDGSQEKKDIEPVYRAATDGSGKYSGSIPLLSELSEVWLYSDYPGTVSLAKLEIKNHSLVFDQKAYIAALSQKSATRALTPNKHKYPDGWKILGDWDEYGTPAYLLPELASPSPTTLYSIKDTYTSVAANEITKRYPEFFDGKMSSDVKIIKPTKVRLAFVSSSAGWNNAVGYFTYPTNQPPTSVKDIQKILAFPNASPIAKSETQRGALLCGDQVQLKYWDGKEFHDEFPAGVSIGWFLEGMGFITDGKNGNIGDVKEQGYSRYSITTLNSDGKQRAVSLKDKNSNQIIAIGFEDNIDLKYNDAAFYLDIEQKDAIDVDTPELPEVTPPKDLENTVTYYGLLAFEDLWPETGDYDMNDVMISYKSTVYRRILNNRVYKIIDEFTPYNDGGTKQTGFGYQFNSLSAGSIKKVTIDGASASTHMEGQMLEPGQDHPTILVFDNIKQGVLNKKLTVTIELNDVIEDYARPPYNPFIFANSNRGIEVHLPKYLPTSKVDASLFGTKGDGSRPEEKLYYVVSHWLPQMPFAINLSGVKDFPIPEEQEKISDTYPGFKPWIASNGATDKDWYKKPKKKE